MFIRFDVIHERDRLTDGRTLHDSIDRACIASRGKNEQFSSVRTKSQMTFRTINYSYHRQFVYYVDHSYHFCSYHRLFVPYIIIFISKQSLGCGFYRAMHVHKRDM